MAPQFLPHDALTGDATSATNFPISVTGGGGGAMAMQHIRQLGGVAGSDAQGVTTAYTWVCPEDVFTVYIEMGGGGSGGGGNGGFQNGGGSGAAWFGWLNLVPGQTYNFTVGQGGGQASGSVSSRLGGTTGITGSATALINAEASVAITAVGGTGGGVGRGQVTYNTGANNLTRTGGGLFSDEFTDNFVNRVLRTPTPRTLFNTTFWNVNGRFSTDGSGATGGTGGSNYWSNGSPTAGNNGGGGGAGYLAAGAAGSDGTAAPGGQGGLTLTWFSTDQTAAMNPLVVV